MSHVKTRCPFSPIVNFAIRASFHQLRTCPIRVGKAREDDFQALFSLENALPLLMKTIPRGSFIFCVVAGHPCRRRRGEVLDIGLLPVHKRTGGRHAVGSRIRRHHVCE